MICKRATKDLMRDMIQLSQQFFLLVELVLTVIMLSPVCIDYWIEKKLLLIDEVS